MEKPPHLDGNAVWKLAALQTSGELGQVVWDLIVAEALLPCLVYPPAQ